jgi:hypothetical protein
VISATANSTGESETFYIERNNTMLHIRLLNGSYLQVFLFLLVPSLVMTAASDISDEIKTSQLNLRKHWKR